MNEKNLALLDAKLVGEAQIINAKSNYKRIQCGPKINVFLPRHDGLPVRKRVHHDDVRYRSHAYRHLAHTERDAHCFVSARTAC